VLIGDELRNIFGAVEQEIDADSAPPRKRGKIVAMALNKGGVGTTTAATNVATNLAGLS
jgi:Flp pilus assembly CpaE family ATPase